MMCTSITSLFFPQALQVEFAELSGDWNPIHVDNRAARRTVAGRTVVHGMHTVLRALERLSASSPGLPLPLTIKVRFQNPLYVDDNADFVNVARNAKELLLQTLVDGTTVTEVRILLGDLYDSRQGPESYVVDHRIPCRELALAEMEARSGSVPLAVAPDAIRAQFPNAVRWLGIDRVAGLLCLSRLVGMECPGLHSLFSGFTIECTQLPTPPLLEYHVTSVDDRFRLLRMDVNGLGLHGRVEAFARHPPVTQVTIDEATAHVTPGEFSGLPSLIVGGSRGLGEVTAKLLAAGGGHPIITYVVGKDDADRVAGEITRWGGHCDVLKYDVRAPAERQLELMTSPVSHLYYYATCPITQRRTRHFSSKAFQEFLDFYVRGFQELCAALHDKQSHVLSVFYPSSVFVEDRPRGMTEYAMAKAAGEVLCADINRLFPKTHITCIRLTRLLTDQTSTFVPTQTASPLDVILPIVRRIHSIRS